METLHFHSKRTRGKETAEYLEERTAGETVDGS